jgi:PmbA protein
MNKLDESLSLLDDLIKKALSIGAEAADGVYVEGVSLSLSQRLGKRENLSRSENADMGLRVLIGSRQAMVSSSDTSRAAMDDLVERCVAMAKAVPEDPYCGLAEQNFLATKFPDLDVCDETEPDTELLSVRISAAEDAARAVSGITNSEGAEASWGMTRVAIAGSNGFSQSRSGSRHSISVSVIAGEGTSMERDYDFDSTVHGEDLSSPSDIGRSAGEMAVNRLNPKKASSAQVPVVYSPRVSNSLVGHLASAINGSSVARGTSFLKDKLGEKIFSEAITIVDDPHRIRGLRSKNFDGEGVGTERLNVVKNGTLNTWILDLRSARQLGLETTGHASRGTSSPPSPSTTNLYLEAGFATPSELISDIKDGFYITEMMGFGINGITGDYSRGASGFWIKNGEISYPVSELTIAGNLLEMFSHLSPANDLNFRYGTNAPTIRVEGMTVAGR